MRTSRCVIRNVGVLMLALMTWGSVGWTEEEPLKTKQGGGSDMDEDKVATETLLLWPDDPERNSPDGLGEEKVTDKTRVHDVKTPHIRIYPAPKSAKPTPAIILVPGGGYVRLVTSSQEPTAKWLSERGVRPFMLMYRCPSGAQDKGALADIQRAIRMVRSRAKEWNIDPDRVGVLGASAGGNLSVRASCFFDTESYPPKDAADKISARPDFTILLFPAYLTQKKSEMLSPSIKIPKDVPPTMIFSARDDKGFFRNSPAYENALKEAGATVRSLYLDEGGHGFILSPAWSESFQQWLEEFKILSGEPN